MDSTIKFDGLANLYEDGRPEYPTILIEKLYTDYGFKSTSIIADIGAGTGKFSKLLLEKGSKVFCVEPNKDMRNELVNKLNKYKKLHAINGTAGNTTLDTSSVDFIISAQAFHWFNVHEFKRECKRILKLEGRVALVWNVREMESPLNQECFQIYKQYCQNFVGFNGGIKRDDERIKEFFDMHYKRMEFPNPLFFDQKGFIKRCISGSYSLKKTDQNYFEYIAALENVFDKYSNNGQLVMENKTVVYIGRLK